MAQVFLYPATGESPLDEDGNPFPSTGLRVTMNAYYEGQCRQGLLVRQDPSAFSSVAQPAVYAPIDLGLVTVALSTYPIQRDGQYLTTIGYTSAGDGGGSTFRGVLAGSGGPDGSITTSNGQWQPFDPTEAAVLVTTLFTLRGRRNGQRILCWGYYNTFNPSTAQQGFGDNGGGWFFWNSTCNVAGNGGTIVRPGDTIAANVYVPAPVTLGAWQRDVPVTAVLRAKWFGAPGFGNPASAGGPGYRFDRDAIQAGMDACRPDGGHFQIEEGNYNIDGPLFTPGTYSNFTVEGLGSCNFYWSGPDTYPVAGPYGEQGSVMLFARGSNCTVKNIRQRFIPGHNLTVAFNAGYAPDESLGGLTAPHFIELQSEGVNRTTGPSNSTLDYCYVLDYFKIQNANCENVTLQECRAARARYACFWITGTIQPFNLYLDRCHFYGILHSVNVNHPYGVGILSDGINGCTLLATNCEFQRLGVILYEREYGMNFVFDGCVGEQVKKIWYNYGNGANQAPGTKQWRGGRFNAEGYRLDAEGAMLEGNTDMLAANVDYIRLTGTGKADILGAVFNDAYLGQDGRIAIYDNDLNVVGCNLPGGVNPFYRIATNGTAKKYTIYAHGNTYQDLVGGGNQQNVAPREGVINPGGSVTISGANTFADVDFTTLGQLDEILADYTVLPTVVSVSGAAVVTTPYVSNLATTGFRINVPTAPGGATSVTINYRLVRT